MNQLQRAFGLKAAYMAVCTATLLVASAFSLGSSPAVSQQDGSQPEIRLPWCSTLVADLKPGAVSQPYMSEMRRVKVRRALIVVTARWLKGEASHLQVNKILYFSNYDDGESEITDSETLARLHSTEASNMIASAAIEKAQASRPLRGFHHAFHYPENSEVVAIVQLFDTPSIQPQTTAWLPHPTLTSLEFNASIGDAPATVRLAARSIRSELNEALRNAVIERFDNSAVIKALIAAGADVNSTDRYGNTPLIVAAQSACNLKTLLEKKPDVSRRNRAGKTALDFAKESGYTKAEQLLEAEIARPKTSNH